MRIKRIKKLRVNVTTFDIKWDKTLSGASFSYGRCELVIGTYKATEVQVLEAVCHELMKMVAEEMRVRLYRPDCDSDYIFVYDHRQHTTMMEMFAGLLSQFID